MAKNKTDEARRMAEILKEQLQRPSLRPHRDDEDCEQYHPLRNISN